MLGAKPSKWRMEARKSTNKTIVSQNLQERYER